jgi:capsular exopolysaccharide synthesis family protein
MRSPGHELTKHPGHSSGNEFDWTLVLAALRRKWGACLVLGLGIGGAVATVLTIYVPTFYTAFSELYIKELEPSVIQPRTESPAHFHAYKQTQAQLVKSPFVLATAIREPSIASTSILRNEPHPEEFLESKLLITHPATEFLRISLSGHNPKELAKIVNSVTEAYLAEVVNSETNKRVERKKYLQRALREIDDKLREKKTAMRKLMEALQTGDAQALTVKQQMALEYFSQLRKEHAQIRFDLLRLKSELAVDKSGRPKLLDIPEAVIEGALAKSAEIASLHARIQQLEGLIVQTQQRVTNPDNPVLKTHRAELARIQSNLELERQRLRPRIVNDLRQQLGAHSSANVLELEHQIALLTSQDEQLNKELEKQQDEAKQIGVSSFEFEYLKREVDQIEKISTRIDEEIQNLDIELEAPSRIKKHRMAEVPHTPDVKKKAVIVAGAGLGVTGTILMIIVLLEIRRRRISSLEQVANQLRLPVIGTLPLMPKRPAAAAGRTRRGSVLQSVWTESIDATRTIFLRSEEFESKKILMITSAVPGEGKTTLSSHLAVSLSRAGRRTLLIDLDLRRPSLHRVFDAPLAPGFCELLRDEASLDEVLQQTASEGLSLITSGEMSPTCLQLLANGGASALFEKVRDRFDFVILDSAPILPVTDSLLISHYVDGALFAVRRDLSQHVQVSTARERLSRLGVAVFGAIAIGMHDLDEGYRASYGAGYHRYLSKAAAKA